MNRPLVCFESRDLGEMRRRRRRVYVARVWTVVLSFILLGLVMLLWRF